MFGLAPRTRTYPVLLPARPPAQREPTRRRARPRPLPAIVAAAIIAVLPAVILVSQRTAAARTGYVILGLRQQVDVLAAEHAQLLATATALRAPDRIERIARADLGMVTPRPQQVAAFPVASPPRVIASTPTPTAWDRFAAWFIRREAAAGEPSQ